MSFMSFDYAMRAADAALQFHQNQGQNIKDTGQKVRDVGGRNAQSKDQLVRQKIEAEYQAKSATVKKEKLEALANMAKERKERAALAQMLVGAGGMLGGMIDGMVDMANRDKDQAPDADQINLSQAAIDAGYATSFRIASETGNSEQGAIAAFDPARGTFSLTGVNTTTGEINGFTTLSATDMAQHIRTAIGDETDNDNNKALLGMIETGPPAMFKSEHFMQKGGQIELSQELQSKLFGDQGFFAQGSRRDEKGHMHGSDAGERLAAGLVQRGIKDASGVPSFAFYNKSAEGIMRMMRTQKIQDGLEITPEIVGKTNRSLKDVNAFGRSALGEGFQKVLLKPLGTALPQFLKMAEVTKQYEEEYQAKLKDLENAKKQAAIAWEKVQRLEALLVAGNDA